MIVSRFVSSHVSRARLHVNACASTLRQSRSVAPRVVTPHSEGHQPPDSGGDLVEPHLRPKRTHSPGTRSVPPPIRARGRPRWHATARRTPTPCRARHARIHAPPRQAGRSGAQGELSLCPRMIEPPSIGLGLDCIRRKPTTASLRPASCSVMMTFLYSKLCARQDQPVRSK